MSKTITVTFTFNQDDLLDQLKEAGSMYNLELKQDLDIESFTKEFSEDLNNFIEGQLEDFFENGIDQDCYLDCFEERDEEDEDED